MQIGSLKLDGNLFLSPLAGYTNLPFRLVVREIGGVGLCTTDLVNARSLLEKRPKAYKLIETRKEDTPLAIQLFGSVPEEMRDAALVAESCGAASVDINMGCPVRKVCQVGGGSAMMTQHKRTTDLVRMMIDAVKIPVTAKMRLGWDDHNITAPDLARALEDAGVAAIFVHGRTRAQGFGGSVNLPGIRKVVQAVQRIPVIGNGDIVTPQAAMTMFQETGCSGVSIGRGAFYDPWIFRRTAEYIRCLNLKYSSKPPGDHVRPHATESPDTILEGACLPPEPTFAERLRVMCRHLDLMIEVFGEELGCRMFRKIAPWHAKQFGPSHEFNRKVVHVSTREEFQLVLDHYQNWRKQFLDENGELLKRYQPAPLSASFMRPVETNPVQINVPKGPVDKW